MLWSCPHCRRPVEPKLSFAPGEPLVCCPFCGSGHLIVATSGRVRTASLMDWLRRRHAWARILWPAPKVPLIPQTQCPKCGVWIDDLDGFGVLYHAACGYCSHASITGGVCGLCGKNLICKEAEIEEDECEWVVCPKCGGSGFFAECFDDLCHGNEECIHGDDPTCSRCHGEGEITAGGISKG